MEKEAVYNLIMTSPVGYLHLKASQQALTAIDYIENKKEVEQIQRPNKCCQEAKQQLEEYFAGVRQTFNIPLKPDGTTFQKKVWTALQQIPYGSTISYGKLARQINNKQAVRAVGRANGQNPVPIIIPCHRVIGSNGHLIGYSGGLWRKRELLSIENHPIQQTLQFKR